MTTARIRIHEKSVHNESEGGCEHGRLVGMIQIQSTVVNTNPVRRRYETNIPSKRIYI
jgi:hypothetical protein